MSSRHSLDVLFAELYLEAVAARDAGERPSDPWALTFADVPTVTVGERGHGETGDRRPPGMVRRGRALRSLGARPSGRESVSSIALVRRQQDAAYRPGNLDAFVAASPGQVVRIGPWEPSGDAGP